MSLKLLRLALHMNTAQAARYLAARPDYPEGVSETTWIRWEVGKKEPPSDLLLHLESVRRELANHLISGSERIEKSELTEYMRQAAEVNKFIMDGR